MDAGVRSAPVSVVCELDKKTIGRDEQKAGIQTSLISLLAVVLLLGVTTVPAVAIGDDSVCTHLVMDSTLEQECIPDLPGVDDDNLFGAEIGDPVAAVPSASCTPHWGSPPGDGADGDAVQNIPTDEIGASQALQSAVATASNTAGDAGGEAAYFLPNAKIHDGASLGVGTAIAIGVSILLFLLDQALQQDYDHGPTPPDKNWYVECTSTMGFEADCFGFELVLEPRECVLQVKDNEDVGSEVEWQDVDEAYCLYGPGVYEGQGHSPEQLYSVEHREGCTIYYDETNNYVAKDGTFIHDSTNSAHNQVPLDGEVCISDGDERLRVANLGRGIGPLPSLASDEIGPTREFDDGRCAGAELDWPPLKWSSDTYMDYCDRWDPDYIATFQDHYEWDPNTNELETETERVGPCYDPNPYDIDRIDIPSISEIRDTVQDLFEENEPDPDTPDLDEEIQGLENWLADNEPDTPDSDEESQELEKEIQELQNWLEENEPDPDTPDPDDVIQEAQNLLEDNKPDPDTPDLNDVIQETQEIFETNEPDPDTPDPDDVIQEAQEIFEDNDPGPLPERPDLGEPPNLSRLNELLQEFLSLLFDGEDSDASDDVLGSAGMS